MKIIHEQRAGMDILHIDGRIDGLSAPDFRTETEKFTAGASRSLVLEFSNVSYMSSAGLRVVLQAHKTIRQTGGELILASVQPPVMEVFRVSGMLSFFDFRHDVESVFSSKVIEIEETAPESYDREGISWQVIRLPATKGKLHRYGSSAGLVSASYSEQDVVKADPCDMRFGAGIASMGDDYSEYSRLFGESAVLGRHFFTMAASEKSFVDYAFFSRGSSHTFNFLHGFGITGDFSDVIRFHGHDTAADLHAILSTARELAVSPVYGIVILAVSSGIHSLNLRRSPVRENNFTGNSVFDPGIFPEWFDFSVDGEFLNNTVVACGVARKDADTGDLGIIPGNSPGHLHAVVFENGLWNSNLADFGPELEKVVTTFEPLRVVHLLPETLFRRGYIGIINLEEV